MREADLTLITKIFVRFGPEESEPVLEKAGREKRRKKQAVRIRGVRTYIINKDPDSQVITKKNKKQKQNKKTGKTSGENKKEESEQISIINQHAHTQHRCGEWSRSSEATMRTKKERATACRLWIGIATRKLDLRVGEERSWGGAGGSTRGAS